MLVCFVGVMAVGDKLALAEARDRNPAIPRRVGRLTLLVILGLQRAYISPSLVWKLKQDVRQIFKTMWIPFTRDYGRCWAYFFSFSLFQPIYQIVWNPNKMFLLAPVAGDR